MSNNISKKKKNKSIYGHISFCSLDYTDCYNYEYLIKEYIAKLIPIQFEKEDWENAKLKHYSEKPSINKNEKSKKFDIDIISQCNNEKKYELIFSSNENQLIVPLSKINYSIKICGVVKQIHNAMINIPLVHHNTVFSKQYIDVMYKSAIQTGICLWLQSNLVGSNPSITEKTGLNLNNQGLLFYNILDKYEEWSSKTYEGHAVSFGFVIDRNDMNYNDITDKVKYLDMLEFSDFAPISEIPFSTIKIDSNGNIKNYLSNCLISKNIKPKSYYHPIQIKEFIEICHSYSNNSKGINYLGVLLLKNSEIVIIKNDKLEWVKRNGKWYNYNYAYFQNCMINTEIGFSSEQIEKLYSYVLNLSFAKTGGCIAIIDKEQLSEFKEKFNINNWFDNLLVNQNEIDENMKKIEENQKKFYEYKLSKRHIIEQLTRGINFYNLDERLMLELSSMDGAIIIDKEGNMIAVSSIVDLTERGEGGGRSAATKTLSKYGIAIKVSTDGYFEIYNNKDIVYTLK